MDHMEIPCILTKQKHLIVYFFFVDSAIFTGNRIHASFTLTIHTRFIKVNGKKFHLHYPIALYTGKWKAFFFLKVFFSEGPSRYFAKSKTPYTKCIRGGFIDYAASFPR